MTLTVTAEQRSALYEQIMTRLSAIDSIPLAAKNGDLERAEQLAREHSDYLSLLLDDLGFGTGTGEAVELASPPELLRRVFKRLRDIAVEQKKYEETKRSEIHESELQIAEALATCEVLLAALDAG